MFAIGFISNPQIEFGELASRGQITLGEFSEEFVAPLVFWAVDEYRISYAVNRRQFVVCSMGGILISFALPESEPR